MDVGSVQQQAADVLLDRGVRVMLPAPSIYRLIGIRRLRHTIRRPKLGTLIAMGKVAASIDVNLDRLTDNAMGEAYRIVAQHGDSVAEFVAIAILNHRKRIERQAHKLANRLKWHLPTDHLAELFMTVILMSNVQDFLTTIRFVQQTNMLKRKTNLSQTESGSIEAE